MARAKTPRKKPRGGVSKFPGKRLTILGALVTLVLFLVGSGVAYYQSPDRSLTEAMDAGREFVQSSIPSTPFKKPEPGETFVAEVVRVVDGDTLIVRYGGEEEKVRLLNIDTPESVHTDKRRNLAIGTQASEFAKGYLEQTQVRLESPIKGSHDNFGRRLATVFRDGENVNVELVRQGWSPYYTKYGKSDRYDGDFRRAEDEARQHKRGIWGDPDYLALMAETSKK